ncbi:MAG: MazG family protein [Clostridia bacterium]|nr:MazG family protein [Clostridia bacterium]
MTEKEALLAAKRYDFQSLRQIVRLLRAPDGCPWDREQTHQSIRRNFIEEVYEVCEAIDCDSTPMLREELGDVLLQVVFHACMAEESGRFTMDDVCDEICRKLIIRHPHIFGDVQADTVDKVLDNWEAIKQQTKGISGPAEAMSKVPRQFPALMRAHKVCGKAEDADLFFEHTVQHVRQHVDALDSRGPSAEEIGRLLMAVCGLARKAGIDPELALSRHIDGYIEGIKG